MKVTKEFLATSERLAMKTMAANAEAAGSGMVPGKTVILVEPENQLAMIQRIRLLEELLHDAIDVLTANNDKAHRMFCAANLRDLANA